MLNYPEISPIALKLGPITVYWYGIMYLLGFIATYCLCYGRRTQPAKTWQSDEIIDLMFYTAVGVVFGGAWGFIVFYQPYLLIEDPLAMLRFWEPGRSFHGGLLGGFLAIFIFCKVHQRRFFEVTDFVAPTIPIGLALGRLGNFINGELWGRVTNVFWGKVFPLAGSLPRHPSQLYEFFLEGVVLFIILWIYSRKPRIEGMLSGWFLILYGLFRFAVEYFREPDLSHGFLAFGWVTMGQALSLPMILVGMAILGYAHHNQKH